MVVLEQVESTLAMQNLQPKIKAIQERYKGDQERIQLETARLYKQAGVNPLAGALTSEFGWLNDAQCLQHDWRLCFGKTSYNHRTMSRRVVCVCYILKEACLLFLKPPSFT
jgi:hypothetical protein